MHSNDPLKNPQMFQAEIDRLLVEANETNLLYFSGFVFPNANFKQATIPVPVSFHGARFRGAADFSGAIFLTRADFSKTKFETEVKFASASFKHTAEFSEAVFESDVDFSYSQFLKDVSFSGAEFTKAVHFASCEFADESRFWHTTFADSADFAGANFGVIRMPLPDQNSRPNRHHFSSELEWLFFCSEAIADFSWAKFIQPQKVIFYQLNRHCEQGLKFQCFGCNLDGITFTDVNWCRLNGRMIIQDELALRFALETGDYRGLAGEEPTLTFDSVANVYRQLITNFEKAKDYDLAEDCFCGAMEMKRLDPERALCFSHPAFTTGTIRRKLSKYLLGQFSILNLYRVASLYGSSYKRALLVLGVLLLIFGVSYPFSGLRMKDGNARTDPNTFRWGPPTHVRAFFYTLGAGVWASLETASFQKRPTVEIVGKWGRRAAGIEVLLVSAQVTLVLLALRRRFRF